MNRPITRKAFSVPPKTGSKVGSEHTHTMTGLKQKHKSSLDKGEFVKHNKWKAGVPHAF